MTAQATGFGGIDNRQTSINGVALVFRASLKTSAGAIIASTATIRIRIFQLMSDATQRQYDFSTNAFLATETSAPTTGYVAATARKSGETTYPGYSAGSAPTGLWTYALSLTGGNQGFSVGGVYIVQFSDESGSPTTLPPQQEREFQFGGAQGDMVITGGGNLEVDIQTVKTRAVGDPGGGSTVYLSTTVDAYGNPGVNVASLTGVLQSNNGIDLGQVLYNHSAVNANIGQTGGIAVANATGGVDANVVTIATQSVTCGAGVTFYPAVGSAHELAVNASGNAGADVQTIKTQAVTCAAGVTILASVGTAATSTAQSGDCYPIVSSGTYGNSALLTQLNTLIPHAFTYDTNNLPKVDVVDILGTQSPAAAGYIGPDWGHVNAPTSMVSLTATTIATVTTATTATNVTNAPTAGDFTATMKTSLNAATPASVTGAVGSVAGNVVGSVGSISGVTFPTNFASLAIDTNGCVTFNNQIGPQYVTLTSGSNVAVLPYWCMINEEPAYNSNPGGIIQTTVEWSGSAYVINDGFLIFGGSNSTLTGTYSSGSPSSPVTKVTLAPLATAAGQNLQATLANQTSQGTGALATAATLATDASSILAAISALPGGGGGASASSVWQDANAGDFTVPGSAGAILTAIAAKAAQIGSGAVLVNSPVSASGAMTIYRGNDHMTADGRAFTFTDPGTWPSLASATSITLTLRHVGVNTDPPALLLAGTVTAGPPQVITFQAHKAQTVLAPSTEEGDYIFDIVAQLANSDTVTLLPEGSATVIPNVTGTGLPSGQPTAVPGSGQGMW